jgi:hypothetical protein
MLMPPYRAHSPAATGLDVSWQVAVLLLSTAACRHAYQCLAMCACCTCCCCCCCRVEAVLRQVAASAAVVWVTHDEQQPGRVGGKILTLPSGGLWHLQLVPGFGGGVLLQWYDLCCMFSSRWLQVAGSSESRQRTSQFVWGGRELPEPGNSNSHPSAGSNLLKGPFFAKACDPYATLPCFPLCAVVCRYHGPH